MDWKNLLLNAGLAAGWYVLGELQIIEAHWAIVAVLVLRIGLGWLAAKLGKPIPVDRA